MVAIKQKLLHSVNSLIVLLISLLGFTTSCKDDEPGRYMYGVPHADFLVSGTIKSVTDDKPIPDIIIEMRNIVTEPDGSNASILSGTGFSYSDGIYHVKSTNYGSRNNSYHLKFVDTDGPLHGEYQTLDTTIVFNDPKFTGGDGSWYAGYTEKTLDIKLKPKE